MEETLFLQDLPGLAVGITAGEKSLDHLKGLNYKGAVGFKDFITKEPLKPEHIFHMASVTKLFVGTAVMQLVSVGKLSLDTKAIGVLPWLAIRDERARDMTVMHLLTHTAGLGDVVDYGWDRPETDEGALRRYLESDEVTESMLLWTPGTGKFRYSNMGYEILGSIIAAASGMSFEEYVARHIFEPLGMTDSTLLTYERTGGSLRLEDLSKAGLAMPHTKDKDNHIILEDCYPYNRGHGPSSTLTTNLRDMEKWAKAQMNRALLPKEIHESMWRPYAEVPGNGEEMGLSWFIRSQKGYPLYGHEGNDDGFRASFWICPELDLHIVVASNLSKAPVKKINKSVFDILTMG